MTERYEGPGYDAPDLLGGPYQPFFSSQGYPAFGGGLPGMGAQMMMSMMLNGLMGPRNMIGLGLNDTNVFSKLQQFQQTQLHNQFMASATSLDADAMMRTVAGALFRV